MKGAGRVVIHRLRGGEEGGWLILSTEHVHVATLRCFSCPTGDPSSGAKIGRKKRAKKKGKKGQKRGDAGVPIDVPGLEISDEPGARQGL